MSLRPHPAQLTGSNSSFLSFSLAVTMDLTALQRDSAIGSAKSPGLSIFFIWSSKFWVRMFISRMDTKKQLCEETVLSHVCPPDTGARFWIITRAFLSPFLTKRLGFWSHTWLTVPPWDKKGKHLTKTSGFRPETSDVYSKSKEKGHLELGSPLGQITLFGKYSLCLRHYWKCVVVICPYLIPALCERNSSSSFIGTSLKLREVKVLV